MKFLYVILTICTLLCLKISTCFGQSLVRLLTSDDVATQFEIDEQKNKIFISTIQRITSTSGQITNVSRLHIYNFTNQLLEQTLTLDSANWNFYPFQIQTDLENIYVFGYKDLGATQNLNFGSTIKVIKINVNSGATNSYQIVYPHFLHTATVVFKNNTWVFLTSLKATHPTLHNPSDLLSVRILNSQFQTIQDTNITHRLSMEARGAIFQIETLNDSLFYVLCAGCKMMQIPNEPSFRTGYHDVAIYNFQLQLKNNDILLASNNTPNWPLTNDLIIDGPTEAVGLVQLRNGDYVQLATYRNANQNPLHPNWGSGKIELYLSKTNNQLQTTNRYYFGVTGIDEWVNYSSRQIAQAGDGRIFSLATTNSYALTGFPDSIQSIYIHAIDSQLMQPNVWVWNDLADVYSQQIKSYPSGIYILANSTQRGGEKFHLLHIGGTAWASNTSQLNLPEWGVFPNPARERVFISGELPSNINLHDMQGRLLHQWPAIESNELQLPALPPGIFLLHGSNAQGQRWPVKKLVVR